MAIYVMNNNKVSDIFVNINGSKKNVISAWANKNGKPAKVFQKKTLVEIVTWATGTDEQISAMLEAHYAGIINIGDYWKVGDERIIHLSQMDAGEFGGIVSEQNVTMVLMNSGGKILETPINGKTECAFIVGQKNSLSVVYNINSEYKNGGWDRSDRRWWCNNTYRNAFPNSIKNIFKKVMNVTAIDNLDNYKESFDYFSLPSEKEVFGYTIYSSDVAESLNNQFDFYKTEENRKKRQGNSGSYTYWWERSPAVLSEDAQSRDEFCRVSSYGNPNLYKGTLVSGISPFGCI